MSDTINCPLVDAASLFHIDFDGVVTYVRVSTPEIRVRRATVGGKRAAAYFDITALAGRTVESVTLHGKITEIVALGEATLTLIFIDQPIGTADSTLYPLIDPTLTSYGTVDGSQLQTIDMALNGDAVANLQAFVDDPLTWFPIGIVHQAGLGTRECELADVAGDLTDWYLEVVVAAVPEVVNADADSWVQDITGSRDTNDGSGVRMRIGRVAGGAVRSYVRFDLSSYGGLTASQIISATLNLVCESVAASAAAAEVVSCVDDTWGEGTITWNNAPTLHTGVAEPFNMPTVDESDVDIDVTDLLKEILSSLSTQKPTFVLKKVDESTTAAFYAHTKEGPDSAKQPTLTFTYTPSTGAESRRPDLFRPNHRRTGDIFPWRGTGRI